MSVAACRKVERVFGFVTRSESFMGEMQMGCESEIAFVQGNGCASACKYMIPREKTFGTLRRRHIAARPCSSSERNRRAVLEAWKGDWKGGALRQGTAMRVCILAGTCR